MAQGYRIASTVVKPQPGIGGRRTFRKGKQNMMSGAGPIGLATRLLRPSAGFILCSRPNVVPQIPYRAIGIGLGLILGIWAFAHAETRGKAIIAAAMAVLFFLPVLIRTSWASTFSGIGWALLGVASYVYLRWAGVAIR